MFFYCPKCKEKNKEFKFNNKKEEMEMVIGINMRGGCGSPITYIKCSKCGNESSGVIKIDIKNEEEEEYFCSIIDLYDR